MIVRLADRTKQWRRAQRIKSAIRFVVEVGAGFILGMLAGRMGR